MAPSTLRGWELRRLAGPSGAVGYTPYDIVRLEALARLVRAGLPAESAARRLDELAAGGGAWPGDPGTPVAKAATVCPNPPVAG